MSQSPQISKNKYIPNSIIKNYSTIDSCILQYPKFVGAIIFLSAIVKFRTFATGSYIVFPQQIVTF